MDTKSYYYKEFPHMEWIKVRIQNKVDDGMDFWKALDEVSKEEECSMPMNDVKKYDDD